MSSTEAVSTPSLSIQANSSQFSYLSQIIADTDAGVKTRQESVQYDAVQIDLSGVYKGLTVLGQEVIKKLNEILKNDLPNGIESLNPADYTAEKTAQRIADGVTGLFGVFQKQNSNLNGEELIAKFMKTIRGGVQQGYGQATKILGDVGAFQFDGVKDGIDKTMSLLEQKLKAFEDNYRKTNGLDSTDTTKDAAQAVTQSGIVAQGGVATEQGSVNLVA